jgi:hypothetical protein
MKKVFVSLTLCALFSAVIIPAEAQQPAKVPRIAWLTGGNIPPDRREAFRLGLRELGYIEGKNIAIEWRIAEGQRDRVTALAEELVRLKKSTSYSPAAPLTLAAQKPRRRPSPSS